MRRRIRNALLACAVLCVAAPAVAQTKDDERLPPYDVQGLKHKKIWVPWVFAFLFAAGCVAVSFKNPHRSHLD